VKVILRIPQTVYRTAVEDLKRTHDFAGERVGFMFGRVGSGRTDTLLLVSSYEAVPDDGYVRDDYVSARINATTIRTMMQRTLTTGESAFHVHVHDHQGTPALSWLDESELARLMPSFARTGAERPPRCDRTQPKSGRRYNLATRGVHLPAGRDHLRCRSPDSSLEATVNLRHSRQSFLGRDSETIISTAKLGIVGLSGGGSHLVQQLGHIGFRRFAIYDPDHVDESNLNRLVGATFADVKGSDAKGRCRAARAPGAYRRPARS
jgi:hypothetical protein